MKTSFTFKNKSVTSINHEKQLVNRLQGREPCQIGVWTKLELTCGFIPTVTLTVAGDTVTEARAAFIRRRPRSCPGSAAAVKQRWSPGPLREPWEYLCTDKAEEKNQFPPNIFSFLGKQQLQWRKYSSLPRGKEWQSAKQMKSGPTCREKTQLRTPRDTSILDKVRRPPFLWWSSPERPPNTLKATLFPYFSNGSLYMHN